MDRLVNPTGQMRRKLQDELRRFMAMAHPQVSRYVLDAHEQLLDEVRGQIVANYEERVRSTVKLLTAETAPSEDRRPKPKLGSR